MEMTKIKPPEVDDLNDTPASSTSLDDKDQKMRILADKFRLDLSIEVEKPPTFLSIGDRIWGTAKNISTIIGRAKSKKTFLVTLVLVAIIIRSLLKRSETTGIIANLPDDQSKVIFFDTEQAAYHVSQIIKRIKRMTGAESADLDKHLLVYPLREADSVQQRKEFIEHIIYNTSGVGIAIIDGCRDLVRSINDEGEGTDLVCSLMKWSSERNIHIINVLHTNKNDQNARGHLGTELINKSETTLLVEKHQQDEEISFVNPEYTRNREFEKFAFSVNNDGLPFITELPEEESRRNRNQLPDEITKDEYLDCCEGWENESRDKAIMQIQKYFDVGERSAGKYLNYMAEENYVRKDQVPKKHQYVYSSM